MLGTAEVMRVFFFLLLFYRPTSSAFEILVGSEFFSSGPCFVQLLFRSRSAGPGEEGARAEVGRFVRVVCNVKRYLLTLFYYLHIELRGLPWCVYRENEEIVVIDRVMVALRPINIS